jgi:flagellar hook assembly protein FlgD
VSGKIVKSITQVIPNAETHCSEITWDGRDDYGDQLARGVYLYTMKLKAEDGTETSKNQKLYIIN